MILTIPFLLTILLSPSWAAPPAHAMLSARKLPVLDDACEQSFLACLGDPECLHCWEAIDDADVSLEFGREMKRREGNSS